jgi:hypothetical protein
MENRTDMQPDIFHIPVRLSRLSDLYEPPEFDPFVDSSEHLAGMERIFNTLRRTSRERAVRATFYLPPEQYSPDLEPACAVAVRRLCDMHIAEIDDELADIRWEGSRTLLFGLLVWAACLFLAISFEAAESLSEFSRLFFSEGLIIVGWVALWYPAEILLYEWWFHNRDKKVYARMKTIEIQVACLEDGLDAR